MCSVLSRFLVGRSLRFFSKLGFSKSRGGKEFRDGRSTACCSVGHHVRDRSEKKHNGELLESSNLPDFHSVQGSQNRC